MSFSWNDHVFVILLILWVLQTWQLLLVDLRARPLTFHSYLKGNPPSKVLVRDFPEDSWWKVRKGKKKKVAWHITEHELMKITNISVLLSSTGRSASVASTCPGSLWNPPTPMHLYLRSPLPPHSPHTYQLSFYLFLYPLSGSAKTLLKTHLHKSHLGRVNKK